MRLRHRKVVAYFRGPLAFALSAPSLPNVRLFQISRCSRVSTTTCKRKIKDQDAGAMTEEGLNSDCFVR